MYLLLIAGIGRCLGILREAHEFSFMRDLHVSLMVFIFLDREYKHIEFFCDIHAPSIPVLHLRLYTRYGINGCTAFVF